MKRAQFLLILILLSFEFSGTILAKKGPTSESKTTYRVQNGDSWWGIAKKFKMKAQDLARLNGRSDKESLYQNELLRLTSSKIASEEMKTLKLKDKPQFPLHVREKIERPFSEITHQPQKGIEYAREKSGWVRTSLAGKVVNIDFMDGYENFVILEHENGWYSVYGNLERVQVIEGQVLPAKERIGTLVKDRGLYFQVNQNKNVINPSIFFSQGN